MSDLVGTQIVVFLAHGLICNVVIPQCVSVSSTEGTEKSDVDLDDLMKTYAHSLQREINVTDTVSY